MARNSLIEGERARDYYKRTKDSDITKIMLKFILDNTELNKDSIVADLAAGSGNFEEYLKDKVKRIDAVELSEEMLKIMKERFVNDDRIKIIESGVENTGLESNTYDAAIMIMALHHMNDARSVLREVSRILVDKGIFILIDRLALNKKLAERFDATDAKEKCIDGGYGHTQRTEKELESLLNEYFKILKKIEMPYDDEKSRILTRVLYSLQKK